MRPWGGKETGEVDSEEQIAISTGEQQGGAGKGGERERGEKRSREQTEVKSAQVEGEQQFLQKIKKKKKAKTEIHNHLRRGGNKGLTETRGGASSLNSDWVKWTAWRGGFWKKVP